MSKTPERPEPQAAAAEPAEASTELEFELDSELKLDEGEGLEDEHELEMKSGVTATNGREKYRALDLSSFSCMSSVQHQITLR